MNKEEFLLDMLDYYTVDPEGRRCRNDGNCWYSPETANKPTSEGCAIGRKLDRNVANLIDKEHCLGIGISSLMDETDNDLPDFMYELGCSFLEACQSIHDKDDNWDFANMCLTNEGRLNVLDTVERFDLDKSKFEKYL